MATTVERGYGWKHRAEKARWQRELNNGVRVRCACAHKGCRHHVGPICPVIISRDTGTNWDLGHTEDRTGWTGPECVPCNRTGGGVRAHAPGMTVRDW